MSINNNRGKEMTDHPKRTASSVTTYTTTSDSLSRRERLTLVGNQPGGTYVLRIVVEHDVHLAFGRFKGGKVVTLPSGHYAYVGSAAGQTGAHQLVPRLLHQASRSGDRAPHSIREFMVKMFPVFGLCRAKISPPREKPVYWHIDYLLDLESVCLLEVLVLCGQKKLEAQVGKFIENCPEAQLIEHGLGATDILGNTHVLRIAADDDWWTELPTRLVRGVVERNGDYEHADAVLGTADFN